MHSRLPVSLEAIAVWRIYTVRQIYKMIKIFQTQSTRLVGTANHSFCYAIGSIQAYKLTSLQAYKITRLQDYKIKRLQAYKLTSSQAIKLTI